jgi:hypothetical protein
MVGLRQYNGWDVIRRKGRSKLSGMFSGYGQPRLKLWRFNAVGEYMEAHEQRDHALDNLDQWDEECTSIGLRLSWRQISMALALQQMTNQAAKTCRGHSSRSSIHGAYVGIHCLHGLNVISVDTSKRSWIHPRKDTDGAPTIPAGSLAVLLQSAVTLHEPSWSFPSLT